MKNTKTLATPIDEVNQINFSAKKEQKVNNINLALSADNNFVPHLCVTLVSLLTNLDTDTSCSIYVLSGGITNENKEKIKASLIQFECKITSLNFLEFNKNCFAEFRQTKGITSASYYRINLPTILPDLEKILYLDSDLVIVGNVRELYEIPFDGSFLLAVQDSSIEMANEYKNVLNIPNVNGYFNSGVILINLKAFRREKISEKIFLWLKEFDKKSNTHDQSALNAILYDKWKPISTEWNQLSGIAIEKNWKLTTYTRYEFELAKKSPKIIHYSSQYSKPWKTESIGPHKAEYFNYLDMTAFQKQRPRLTPSKLTLRIIYYTYFIILPNSVKRLIKRIYDLFYQYLQK